MHALNVFAKQLAVSMDSSLTESILPVCKGVELLNTVFLALTKLILLMLLIISRHHV